MRRWRWRWIVLVLGRMEEPVLKAEGSDLPVSTHNKRREHMKMGMRMSASNAWP
jgi:hypothetical protein